MRTADGIRQEMDRAKHAGRFTLDDLARFLDYALRSLEGREQELLIEREKFERTHRMLHELISHINAMLPMPSLVVIKGKSIEIEDTYGVRAAMTQLHEALERAAQDRKVPE